MKLMSDWSSSIRRILGATGVAFGMLYCRRRVAGSWWCGNTQQWWQQWIKLAEKKTGSKITSHNFWAVLTFSTQHTTGVRQTQIQNILNFDEQTRKVVLSFTANISHLEIPSSIYESQTSMVENESTSDPVVYIVSQVHKGQLQMGL